jgi:ribosomal protein S18 acetylase RimI-like enzyme
MSLSILIAVTEQDQAFLFQLFCAGRPELAGFPEPLLQMQFRAQSLGYAAQYPAARHRLVLLHGRPIGRLFVDRSAERIHLVDITILPEQRGRGIGTSLLQALQAEASTASLPLSLSVFESNPAQRLYERLGFRVTGYEPPYRAMQWLPETGGSA